jgi:hypothetical protein
VLQEGILTGIPAALPAECSTRTVDSQPSVTPRCVEGASAQAALRFRAHADALQLTHAPPERQPRRVPVLLSGVPVDERLVRQLAAIMGKPVGAKLEQALLFRASVVALSRDEKTAVLSALEKAPAGLEELRELLLADERWRFRERL